jgi:hypothetical protein
MRTCVHRSDLVAEWRRVLSESGVPKRLAPAVRFRPWPPHSKALAGFPKTGPFHYHSKTLAPRRLPWGMGSVWNRRTVKIVSLFAALGCQWYPPLRRIRLTWERSRPLGLPATTRRTLRRPSIDPIPLIPFTPAIHCSSLFVNC